MLHVWLCPRRSPPGNCAATAAPAAASGALPPRDRPAPPFRRRRRSSSTNTVGCAATTRRRSVITRELPAVSRTSAWRPRAARSASAWCSREAGHGSISTRLVECRRRSVVERLAGHAGRAPDRRRLLAAARPAQAQSTRPARVNAGARRYGRVTPGQLTMQHHGSSGAVPCPDHEEPHIRSPSACAPAGRFKQIRPPPITWLSMSYTDAVSRVSQIQAQIASLQSAFDPSVAAADSTATQSTTGVASTGTGSLVERSRAPWPRHRAPARRRRFRAPEARCRRARSRC